MNKEDKRIENLSILQTLPDDEVYSISDRIIDDNMESYRELAN